MNKNIEYREIVKITDKIKLSKDDILKLIDIVTHNIEDYHNSIELKFQFDNKTQTFKNKEELIANFPEEIDTINFKIIDWRNINGLSKDIVGGINITINSVYIDFQISSYDENWFIGLKSKLLLFFKEKKNKFSLISRIFPFLSGALITLSSLLSISFLKSQNYSYFILFLIITIIVGILMMKDYSGKFFPHTKFVLKEESSWFTFNNIVGVSTIIGAICAFILLVKDFLK